MSDRDPAREPDRGSDPEVGSLDAYGVGWNRDLSTADYVEYCMEVHGQARSASVFVEILAEVPEWNRLRATIERASRSALRLRQHVVTPVLPVAAARWVTDPDFDLDYHLRRISLPGPGSLRQLLDLAQTIQATPLDLKRPLWEATLVEGLAAEDGAAAIVWKLSAPLIAGLSGVMFDREVHHSDPGLDDTAMPPVPVPEDLSPGDLTRAELRRLPITAGRGINRGAGGAIRQLAHSARNPVGTVQSIGRFARSLQAAAAPPPPTAPSPLLRRRSLNRRFDALDVDFASLRAAGRAQGCSVHDAYLAAVCGGLRLYHDRLGVPVATLPLAMPIDVRTAGEPGGDLWSGVRIAAPIDEADPATRMRRLRRAVLTARAEAPATVLHPAAPIVPWLPVQLLSALGEAGRGVDVHVSSTSGHPGTVYIAGRRMTRAIPLGPRQGTAVAIVACSMSGRLYLGINSDPLAVAEPETFLDCLRAGFDEVVGAAQPAGTSS